jgi:hypothetical protein
MKQAAILMFVSVFFIGMSEGVFAQEKVRPDSKESSPLSAPVYIEEYRMGGIITNIDPTTGKITIKQRKINRDKTVTLNLGIGGNDKISAFCKGDAVNVWVKGKTVTKIEKIPDSVWEEIRKEGK